MKKMEVMFVSAPFHLTILKDKPWVVPQPWPQSPNIARKVSKPRTHYEKYKHKCHRHVSSSSEESILLPHSNMPFPGEEPGREEGKIKEPRPSIKYSDLKGTKGESCDKKLFSPDPIISR